MGIARSNEGVAIKATDMVGDAVRRSKVPLSFDPETCIVLSTHSLLFKKNDRLMSEEL